MHWYCSGSDARALSNSVASALDGLHDLRHILLAGAVVGCFHHDAHDRFGTRLTHENATSALYVLSTLLSIMTMPLMIGLFDMLV